MTNIIDNRSIPSNNRVGWIRAYPKCIAKNLVDGELCSITSNYANLLSEPNGNRVRQLVYGDTFRVLEKRSGFSFGFNSFDGYVGYIKSDNLEKKIVKSTHWVSSLSSQVYATPDIKKHFLINLPFGAQVEIIDIKENFCETSDGGFVPTQHLTKMNKFYSDAALVANFFIGTPYLWGGNTCWGIDCSGLMQAAFRACGVVLPADSDQQETRCIILDEPSKFKRNDLIFWDGHVALAVDDKNLIHANAFHMSVTLEPINVVIKRMQLECKKEHRLCRFKEN